MSVHITQSGPVQQLLRAASGLDQTRGNPRTKQILYRLLNDICQAIEDLEITPTEFWAGVNYLNDLGAATEAGLLAPGLGLERFLDLRMDAAEAEAGLNGGTPRAIEGPLYVASAPLCDGFARLDDGIDPGKPLIMHGVVRNIAGNPLPSAIVDVWHCNSKGLYSVFDPSQSRYNLRRRIRTDRDGRYKFQSIVPSGYACPPLGVTQALLNELGRHGNRPAHIHFFVSAEGHRKITTQINIDGDEFLRDDFAHATREGLIAKMVERTDVLSISESGVGSAFSEIEFDFTLKSCDGMASDDAVERRRVQVA